MPGQDDEFVVYNLRQTYHEPGEYEFRVVLDPSVFRDSRGSELSVVDADGRPLTMTVRRWGRKMNCVFVIDDGVADGVVRVVLSLRRDDGTDVRRNVTFWVVK